MFNLKKKISSYWNLADRKINFQILNTVDLGTEPTKQEYKMCIFWPKFTIFFQTRCKISSSFFSFLELFVLENDS